MHSNSFYSVCPAPKQIKLMIQTITMAIKMRMKSITQYNKSCILGHPMVPQMIIIVTCSDEGIHKEIILENAPPLLSPKWLKSLLKVVASQLVIV